MVKINLTKVRTGLVDMCIRYSIDVLVATKLLVAVSQRRDIIGKLQEIKYAHNM